MSHFENLSNSLLIKESRKGNREAFHILIEKHKNSVRCKIIALVGNEHDADDILQDTFMKAYSKIDTFTENHSFAGWLYTIAHNIFIDTLRKAHKGINVELTDYNQNGVDCIDDDSWQKKEERITSLEELILELPKQYREVLNMRFLLDMDYESISIKLNVPVGTIKTWIHRAKNELKKQYKQ